MKEGKTGKGKMDGSVRERGNIGLGKDGKLGEGKIEDCVSERGKIG